MSKFKKVVWVQDDGSAAASVEYNGTVKSLGRFDSMADADKAVEAWVNNSAAREKGKAA